LNMKRIGAIIIVLFFFLSGCALSKETHMDVRIVSKYDSTLNVVGKYEGSEIEMTLTLQNSQFLHEGDIICLPKLKLEKNGNKYVASADEYILLYNGINKIVRIHITEVCEDEDTIKFEFYNLTTGKYLSDHIGTIANNHGGSTYKESIKYYDVYLSDNNNFFKDYTFNLDQITDVDGYSCSGN